MFGRTSANNAPSWRAVACICPSSAFRLLFLERDRPRGRYSGGASYLTKAKSKLTFSKAAVRCEAPKAADTDIPPSEGILPNKRADQ